MADDQRHGRIFGVLFIITFITSIAALALFQPVLDDPVGYITGGGKDNQIYLGLSWSSSSSSRTSERPSSSTRSRGVRTKPSRSATSAARIIESIFIAMGIIFVLGVVGLRHDLPSADDAAFTLAALKDWTFLFGPGFIVPLGNGLTPRLPDVQAPASSRGAWPGSGLIGGPLLFFAERRRAVRLVGRGQHCASLLADPRVHLGGVPRDLLRDLGVQEGLSDPSP